jgi:hypothetical protein
MGNEQSASLHHEPISPYASSTVITSQILKPTKSVIKRSRSSEDESSSSCQEPSTNTLPLSSSASSSSSSRYIPNMNPRKGNNGLIVPTRPYGSHHHQSKCTENQSNTNGSEMSPQWGWYINTTPPTPELYHSRSPSKSSFSSGGGGGNSGSIKPINEQLDTITSSSHLSCSSNSNSNTIVDGNTCQNQVFKNLKNSNAPIHGWTSIPI